MEVFRSKMIWSDVCLKYYSTKNMDDKWKTKLKEGGRGRQAAWGQSTDSTQVHFSAWIKTEKKKIKVKKNYVKNRKQP